MWTLGVEVEGKSVSLAQCKAENKRGAALVTGSKVQVSSVTEVRIWLCWSDWTEMLLPHEYVYQMC